MELVWGSSKRPFCLLWRPPSTCLFLGNDEAVNLKGEACENEMQGFLANRGEALEFIT